MLSEEMSSVWGYENMNNPTDVDRTSPEYLRTEARVCEECNISVCPEMCFNIHVGSMIALGKLINAMGRKGDVHIVQER